MHLYVRGLIIVNGSRCFSRVCCVRRGSIREKPGRSHTRAACWSVARCIEVWTNASEFRFGKSPVPHSISTGASFTRRPLEIARFAFKRGTFHASLVPSSNCAHKGLSTVQFCINWLIFALKNFSFFIFVLFATLFVKSWKSKGTR